MSNICIIEEGKTEELEINNFPWDDNGYRPQTTVRLSSDNNALYVEFISYDSYIKTVFTEHNSTVHKDSCVELFICPNPDKDLRYLNFEINANGVMMAGLGSGRHGRRLLSKEECMDITVHSERFEGGFKVKLCIPFGFMEKWYGAIDRANCRMSMNLYKCGDETKYPHYGCWSLVKTENPDFHRPEYFGQLFIKQ